MSTKRERLKKIPAYEKAKRMFLMKKKLKKDIIENKPLTKDHFILLRVLNKSRNNQSDTSQEKNVEEMTREELLNIIG